MEMQFKRVSSSSSEVWIERASFKNSFDNRTQAATVSSAVDSEDPLPSAACTSAEICSAATAAHVGGQDRKKENATYKQDWTRMAEIFDRLFFWFFLLAIIVTTLVLFKPLIKQLSQ